MRPALPFGPHGPFDPEERAVVRALVEAVVAAARPNAHGLLEAVHAQIERCEKLGELIDSYPSIFSPQALGSRHRDLQTLVDMLSKSNLSNFDMFVPTKALLSRDMVMAEVNFYRLLRLICAEALAPEVGLAHRLEIERLLCTGLYSRLAEEVLKHIASDENIAEKTRAKAVLSLALVWERNVYKIRDVFPALEAAWEARRRVPATLGTMMGTSEMFGLMLEGCDPAFVDFLVRPDHSPDEAAAFREFLFGTHTEHLRKLEARMQERGLATITRLDSTVDHLVCDAYAPTKDPASAMFEFFLSRHLQAAARRLANLPGPKRTAEEYVMLHFLEQREVEELTGLCYIGS